MAGVWPNQIKKPIFCCCVGRKMGKTIDFLPYWGKSGKKKTPFAVIVSMIAKGDGTDNRT